MPIIKSAIKRVRQAAKRRSLNLQVKRNVHRDIRELTDAITAGDASLVQEKLRAAVSEIDRAVKKGTMHKNTAGRRKSQLARAANTVNASTTAPSKPKTTKKPAATKKAPAKKPAAKKAKPTK